MCPNFVALFFYAPLPDSSFCPGKKFENQMADAIGKYSHLYNCCDKIKKKIDLREFVEGDGTTIVDGGVSLFGNWGWCRTRGKTMAGTHFTVTSCKRLQDNHQYESFPSQSEWWCPSESHCVWEKLICTQKYEFSDACKNFEQSYLCQIPKMYLLGFFFLCNFFFLHRTKHLL